MKKRYPILIIISATIILATTLLTAYSEDDITDYSNMVGLEFPTSFDEFIAPYGEISDDNTFNNFDTKYNVLFKQINDDEIDDELENEYINIFNNSLREMGYPLPYISFSAFLNSIDNLTNDDREKLLALYEEYSYNDDYEESEKMIVDILKKYHLNGIEVLDQLSEYTYKYAIFSVDGSNIKLDNSLRANVKEISKEKKELYIKIINEVFEIAPSSIGNQINTVEFSTDGLDRNLAYVVQNDDFSKFRLSIDEKDAINEMGNFTREGLETLIHEFGHIITLNKDQIDVVELDKNGLDITKTYKENSYLKDFYNSFWIDIYDDYKSYDNNDFYNKYEDQFVTDYAAVNIDEDIAESFRIYIFGIETKKDSIASKKIEFFNNYPELVQLKEHFRKVLDL
jgi:hypothetical protein